VLATEVIHSEKQFVRRAWMPLVPTPLRTVNRKGEQEAIRPNQRSQRNVRAQGEAMVCVEERRTAISYSYACNSVRTSAQ
jgi:hypothetical protein